MREDTNLRIIKRYQNRKLYDTFQSCYVTLEEISQIIREGHEIKVIDNKSKSDITYMTQVQLLFDMERKQSSHKDCDLLKRVIRSTAGTFTGHIRELESQLGIGTPLDKLTSEAVHTDAQPAESCNFDGDSLESPTPLN